MASPRLGSFEVLERLGIGGMGEVWSARHVALDQPVAVKVITGALATEERFRDAFTDEVRAVARLRHRGIVEVLDYGTCGAESPFPPGSPYLVMARADGVVRDRPPRGWTDIRELLLELLSALAHAHARGVVHLDIKPGNILRFGDRVALTDFGVSAFLGEAIRRDAVRGSAAYMAPEQFAGRWRDYGPATDLYALGTVAWELLCGEVPFRSTDPTTLGNLKRTAPPPQLPDELAPPSLRRWLEAMLATDVRDRFGRAADASAALLAVPPDATVRLGDHQQLAVDATFALSTFWDGASEIPASARAGRRLGRPARAPAGAQWRASSEDPELLKEALGLGLFGIRPPPFVGRERDRDALWGELMAVEATGEPRVVWVEGAQGVGATALSEWTARRADELGTAIALVTEPGEELDAFWRRVLLGEDLAVDDLVAQLMFGHVGLPEELAQAVAAMLQPGSDLGARERLAIAVDLLGALAAERPVVLALDRIDPERGALALAVAQRVHGPVLVLVTARTEQVSADHEVRTRLEELVAAGATRVLLEPLGDGAIRLMIQRLVHLSGGVAAELLELAAGNPQMVIHTLARWIDEGLLRSGPGGFERVGPDLGGRSEDWERRAELAIAGVEARGEALERAAVLGDVVERSVWRACCEGLEPGRVDAAEDALHRAGLAQPAAGGWSFGHPLLRAALINRARAAGRLVSHHRRVAAVFAQLGPAYALRRGDHLYEGELWQEATQVLIASVMEQWNRLHVQRARTALTRARRAAERLEDSAQPLRRVQGVEAQFAIHGGRYDEAMALAVELIEQSLAAGDEATLARGLRARGMIYQLRGQLAAAALDLEKAANTVSSHGDHDLACAIEMTWMQALLQAGRLEEAKAVAERFRPIKPRQVAASTGSRGILASYIGDHLQAVAHYEDAVVRCRQLGLRVALTGILTNLGDAHRALNDFEAAERCLAEAIRLSHSLGVTGEPVIQLNRAQMLLSMGDADRAWEVLEAARAGLERLGRNALLGAAHAVTLRCLAMRGDWARWDRHFERSVALLDGSGMNEPEVVEAYAAAADLAEAAGLSRRAQEARERAVAHRVSR